MKTQRQLLRGLLIVSAVLAGARGNSLNETRLDSLINARYKQVADARNAAMDRRALSDSLVLAGKRGTAGPEVSFRTEAESRFLATGVWLLDSVYFAAGETELSADSRPYLDGIAIMLSRYPRLWVQVSGYADDGRGAAQGLKLGQGRAESVMKRMNQAMPGRSRRLTAVGYSGDPSVSDRRPILRTSASRSELLVLNKEALREYP